MSDPELDALSSIPDPLAAESEALPEPPDPEKIAKRVLGEKSPTRADVRRARAFALVLAIGWCAAELAVLGLRGDLGELPPGYLVAWLFSPLALATLAAGVATHTGKTGLGVRISIAASLAVLGPLMIAVLAMLLRNPNPTPPRLEFWKAVTVCLELTLAGAAAPLAFAVLSMRHAFAANARWRSALLGAAAGLVAGAVTNAHCPNAASMHLLLGHALPIAIAAIFGALVGYKLTRS